MDFHARYLATTRAFLRDPSPAAMAMVLAAYTLWHNARYGSEAGLDTALEAIERNCRNIMTGKP